MFRQLAGLVLTNGGRRPLSSCTRPSWRPCWSWLLESLGRPNTSKELGHPASPERRARGVPDSWSTPLSLPQPAAAAARLPSAQTLADPSPTAGRTPLIWDHLIYAYMIENTRIYEIFRRVVAGVPPRGEARRPGRARERGTGCATRRSSSSRTPAPFSRGAVTSHAPSDFDATRRNAYTACSAWT